MNTIDKQSQDKKAKKYNKIKRRISVITLVLQILLLLVILFSGISTELRDMVSNVFNSPWIIVAFYTISLGLAAEVISLPLDFYSSYTLEHKFQLSNQSLWNWILDLFKGMGISLVLGLLLVEILYWVLRSFPQSWWIIAGIIFSLIFIILAKLAPVILMPIFFKFKPITDDELKDRLATLVKKAGTNVNGVFEMDLSKKSKTANAGLTGWGNTRRIILADTLLNNYSYDEIEVVLAHEFGHHRFNHLWKGIAVQTASTFFAFYVANIILLRGINLFNFNGLGDIANFPLFLLVISIISLMFMPFSNMYSRMMERQADKYALEITQKPESFISSMQKLAEQNLAEMSPNPIIEFIFHSHPSIGKRIEQAKIFNSA